VRWWVVIESRKKYIRSFTFPTSPLPGKPTLFLMLISLNGDTFARLDNKGKPESVMVPCTEDESDQAIYDRMVEKIAA
jgi:hypothetical protein